MVNARGHPNFVTNNSAYLLTRLDLVPASKVSPKTSCCIRLYHNCRSFVCKWLLKEGWSTVRSPLWVVHSNVQYATSNPNPHFAVRSVGYVGCIRVEACPPTLKTIMWPAKTFYKFPPPYYWRYLQGFECIPATNCPLNSSGIFLNNPPVVKSAYFWAEKEGSCGSHSGSAAVALQCVQLLYSSIVGFLEVK